MKTAGSILSALFDEGFVKKAKGYSKLFDSWTDITAKNGIAAAADHSRIKDLDRGILLVEMDHPGWKQILQTKQSKLLNDIRLRFPELDVSGISLILSRSKPSDSALNPALSTETTEVVEAAQISVEPEPPVSSPPYTSGYDAIQDEEFREKLKKLGQAIADRGKKPT